MPEEDARQVLPEKGANGRSGAASKDPALLLSLLKPKYNGQSSAIPFLDHSTRHIGRTHGTATSRDTLYIWMMSKVKVSEEQSIDTLILVTLARYVQSVPKIPHPLKEHVFEQSCDKFKKNSDVKK